MSDPETPGNEMSAPATIDGGRRASITGTVRRVAAISITGRSAAAITSATGTVVEPS